MAMYHNIHQLDAALNTAVVELGLHCNFRTLQDRMSFLSQNATVYNLRCCHCSPDKQFNTFDPPEGSLCSWSILISLLTGLVDPRASLNAFASNSLLCHSPYGPNMQQAEYDIFTAFTDYTKVVISNIQI